MAAHVKDSMYTVLRYIMRANKVYNNRQVRLDMLNAIDAEIQLQKVLVRMAYKYRYISNQNYLEWSRRLDEIGRILGGWIRATVGQDVQKPI